MKKGIAVAVASIASLAVGIGGTYYYMSSNPITKTKVTNETKKVDKEKNEKITCNDVGSDHGLRPARNRIGKWQQQHRERRHHS